MSVPRYRNLRKERHEQQLKDLQVGKQVNSTISRKLHNFHNDIEEDLEEKDDRSNYERNEDLNQIRQQIGAKLNKLFNNDHDEVNTFMEFINENQISIQDFNAVYPELLQNSDPNTNTASYSIPKFQQLLNNDYGNTKEITLMKDIYQLIERIYKNGGISEKKADEMVDMAEASVQLNEKNEMLKELQKIMKQKKKDEDKLIEVDKMIRPNVSPQKKKLNDEILLQRVSFDEWHLAKSKEVLKKSFKIPQLKEILDENGIKTFKQNTPKNELIDLVWDLKQIV